MNIKKRCPGILILMLTYAGEGLEGLERYLDYVM